MSRRIEEERDEFQVRPRAIRSRDRSAHSTLNSFTRLVRATSAPTSKRGVAANGALPSRQRCAVRFSYSTSRVPGHFAAHARYLVRDSAAGEGKPYGTLGEESMIAGLGRWQSAGDRRLFKMIVSPEFGERVDLTQLASGFMARIERDLNRKLEWAAVNHYNTDHPHVHIAIRGVDANGKPFRFDRDYIKTAFREHAAVLCTEQLGHRTREDVDLARRREVDHIRFTSLDRRILQLTELHPLDPGALRVVLPHPGKSLLLSARLRFLTGVGIAREDGPSSWLVPVDLEGILKTMQNTADRQRMLAQLGVAISDQRLSLRMTEMHEISSLSGRVLGHVENETSGSTYMVLEGSDGVVHFIRHEQRIEVERSVGKLKPGVVIEIQSGFLISRNHDLGAER